MTRTVPASGIISDACPYYGEELHGALELPATSQVVGKTNVAFFTADHTDCGDTISVFMTAQAYMSWDHLDEYATAVESLVGYSR
ncbi:MAG: hypothetical protein RLN75_07920, partial [Longimicrobiales bacterium]